MKTIDAIFDRNKFLLRQKFLSIAEKYYVFDEQKKPLLYIERPRHAARNMAAALGGLVAALAIGILCCFISSAFFLDELIQSFLYTASFVVAFVTYFVAAIALSQKRHITFYQDDTKQEKLLEILQNEKISFPQVSYTINDAEGQMLAKVQNNYLYAIFRRYWHCYSPDGASLCIIREDDLIMALLRRMFGTFFGALRTNFVFLNNDEVSKLGEFNPQFTILDHYVLDMSADTYKIIDRRIALALGVLLDTGERR